MKEMKSFIREEPKKDICSVMLAVRPISLKQILNGLKTVEVRFSRPKTNGPFKVYLYCTKNSESLWILDKESRSLFPNKICDVFAASDGGGMSKGNGMVVGEFICNKVVVAECGSYCNIPLKQAQLDAYELMTYAEGKTVYGWYISELVVYDKPKKLSEFTVPTSYKTGSQQKQRVFKRGLKPPQSWVYAEEAKHE